MTAVIEALTFQSRVCHSVKCVIQFFFSSISNNHFFVCLSGLYITSILIRILQFLGSQRSLVGQMSGINSAEESRVEMLARYHVSNKKNYIARQPLVQ